MKPTYPALLWRDKQPETVRVVNSTTSRLWNEFLLGFTLLPPMLYRVTTAWMGGETTAEVILNKSLEIAKAIDLSIQNQRGWR